MPPRKVLFFVCMILSVFCLAAGYAIARQWIGACAAILIVPAWLFVRKHPGTWLLSICLFASVGLAVTGRLTGSPSWLMICSSGIALAVWDLLFLDDAMGSKSSNEQSRRYESRHLQSLALALGSGLLVAFLGRLLNLQIPFIAMMLLIALLIFGFERIWGLSKNRGATEVQTDSDATHFFITHNVHRTSWIRPTCCLYCSVALSVIFNASSNTSNPSFNCSSVMISGGMINAVCQ